MKKIKFFIYIFLFTFIGCSYSLFQNAYPHIKNIQISSFENNTSEYVIAQDFQDYLVGKFQSDGRLKITTIEPDSFVEGSILDYKHEILSYDNYGNILEYKVSILFSLQMTDIRMQNIIFENKALLLSEAYSPNDDNPDVLTTENQAQEMIFEKAFNTIIRNTLESW